MCWKFDNRHFANYVILYVGIRRQLCCASISRIPEHALAWTSAEIIGETIKIVPISRIRFLIFMHVTCSRCARESSPSCISPSRMYAGCTRARLAPMTRWLRGWTTSLHCALMNVCQLLFFFFWPHFCRSSSHLYVAFSPYSAQPQSFASSLSNCQHTQTHIHPYAHTPFNLHRESV